MKKIILYTVCLAVMLSCKKENNIVEQAENSSQLLSKAIKTVNFSSGASYSEIIEYKYDNAPKIIAEGNKSYVRDDRGRIVRIFNPGTKTNRDNIQVYYSGPETTKISYTFCALVGGIGTDSVVYLHDNNGRLIKTESYFSSISDGYSTGAFLSGYQVFSYDADGNIAKLDLYNVDNGQVIHCGQYNFGDYDKMINPQYAADEVRTMEYSWDGVINSSLNNFKSINGRYTKSYEYRMDGRPRSCIVTQNGTYAFKLTFEYK